MGENGARRSRRRAAGLAASGAAMALAAAGAARATTLADAISLAYAHNPNLQAQRAQVQSLDETYVQTRSQYGAQVQLQASANYEELRAGFFRVQQEEATRRLDGANHQEARTGTLDLSLTQSIYTSGRLKAALNGTEAAILQGRENLRLTEIQVVQQVISAYVSVRRDLQIVDINRDTVSALERQLEQTNAEFAVRQVTQTDVDETRGRLAAARAAVANARFQLEVSRSQYLQTVGEPADELAPEPELDGLPPTLDKAFDITEASSAAILAAQYGSQAADARVAEARRSYGPQLSVRLDVTRNPVLPYSAVDGDQHAVSAALNLTQPLYTSGQASSVVRQQLADANQARAQLEVQRRSAIQAVSQSWAQLVAARASLVSDADGVRATQAAFYGVRREEPFGLRQPIDVLNAVLELNQAETRFLQDRASEYNARAGVLGGAGLLEAALLAPDLDKIRPETNFNRVRDSGALPWEKVVRVFDAIGAGRLSDPRPASRDAALRRPEDAAPLDPAPPPAATLKPFRSATSIMTAEAEAAVHPPAGAPGSDAPLARCNLAQSERTGCEPGASAGALAGPAATAPAPRTPAPVDPTTPGVVPGRGKPPG